MGIKVETETYHTKDTTSSGRVDASGQITCRKQPECDFQESKQGDQRDG